MKTRRPFFSRTGFLGVRSDRSRRPGLEPLHGRTLLSGATTITAGVVAPLMSPALTPVHLHATFNDSGTGADRVVVDWGDGTHSSAAVSTISYIPGASGNNHGLSDSHVYQNGGTYKITATILGPGGAVGQVTSSASIASPYYTTAPAPASSPGPLMPLFRDATPFGTNNPDLATAEVNGLSNAILGHAPDPATLAADVALLKAGMPVAAVASQMLHSPEYETNLVASYYQGDLGRTGSPSEVAAWVGQMQGGMTAEQVADDFLTSAEFNADHPDDNSFILSLYEDVLDRAPAPVEIAAWTGALGPNLSRSAAVADFLASDASRSVQGFYTAFLGRQADPTGLQVNASLLESGVGQSDLAAAIAGSTEFAALAKKSVG